MRYEIKNGVIVESMFIDAPYDTKADAKEALDSGIKHNCQYCFEPGDCPKNQYINTRE